MLDLEKTCLRQHGFEKRGSGPGSLTQKWQLGPARDLTKNICVFPVTSTGLLLLAICRFCMFFLKIPAPFLAQLRATYRPHGGGGVGPAVFPRPHGGGGGGPLRFGRPPPGPADAPTHKRSKNVDAKSDNYFQFHVEM